MLSRRIAAAAILVGGLSASAACGMLGTPEGQGSFACTCHESEQESEGPTMYVCADNEHGAVAAAKRCHGTASNAACTCTAEKKPCRPGGCR